ncbi:type III-A CRISPR-associated protein Cas10/Csm1 [Leptotrichia sp. OH3620_COT-345]|uniref:type III-A CRISPR-associated protein Cas10/Csm1 n=1 Tax=Leptotrichia sp. OH3620_COT-345 TaxID=2491048 RepID=UPI000F655276|nr:type III-A CRISPR-associated protein Cas10/Csm1 [Leptotrichia sp. OH3620_COT-345]RRD40016.1 type III-A CRISPR-associated protein Cas10/Csm1 [Leptotrichia sp. OH3620_COT-345]
MYKFENMEQVVSLAGLLHDLYKSVDMNWNFTHVGIEQNNKNSASSEKIISFLEKKIEPSDFLEKLKIIVSDYYEDIGFKNKNLKQIKGIILKASEYSANERKKEQMKETDLRSKQLNSIFESISIRDNKRKTASEMKYMYKLGIISPENIFPEEVKNEGNMNFEEDLHKHIENFFKEMEEIKVENYSAFYSQIYTLLEKYTWCIALDTQNKSSDISLFDHLRNTSALALASYKYYKEKGLLDKEECSEEENQFLVIIGDINGIQDFIYDEMEIDGAAKLLRGRSFFVKILSDVISLYLIKELELNISNIVLTAGGKFYVIAPNTQETNEKIKKIKKKLNDYLYRRFFGQLFVNIVTVESNGNEISKNFNKIIEYSNILLDENKSTKFSEQIMENPVFNVDYYESDGRKSTAIDRLNEELKKMGEKIPKSEYIGVIFDSEKLSEERKETFEIIENLNIKFFNRIEIKEYKEKEKIDMLLSLNNTEIIKGYPMIFRFTNNYTPMENKVIKSFDDISKSAKGNQKIAVYKADVDNLGMIFSIGLKGNTELDKEYNKKVNSEKKGKTDYNSLSRIATLSRNMEYFFSYWLNQELSKQNEEIKINGTEYLLDFKDIYVLYSGGDDLILIGSWDKIIFTAYYIRKKFEEYTTENDNITISGGIAIVHPKIQISRGVDIANELEEKAKESNEDKDSLAIFNKAFKWEKFEEIFGFAEQLFNIAVKEENNAQESDVQNKKILSQGFLYRNYRYVKMAEKFWEQSEKGNPDFRLLTYISKFEYDYGRNIREKLEKLKKEEIKELMKVYKEHFNEEITEKAFINNYMGIVLNYVLNANRKNNNREVE